MAKKVVISVVSLILVVGVVVGVVAVVHRNGNNNKNNGNSNNVSTASKAVSSFCAGTDYKDVCTNSLSSVAKNASASPKDYIMAAFGATFDEMKKAFNVSHGVDVDGGKLPGEKMAVDDCKELMEMAVQDLQAAFSWVGDAQMHTLKDRVSETLLWLSAVVTYQQSCLEELDLIGYKSPIPDSLFNATRLTSNAISIIAGVADILQGFNFTNFDFSKLASDSSLAVPKSRRLLEVTQVGHDGYPSWIPEHDRKLLALQDQGAVKPNAVVAQDGSGQYKTISAAVAAIPKNRQGRWIIYVKAGVYSESVIVPSGVVNVLMYGDGPTKTIVTGAANFKILKISTMQSATFAAVGAGFIAKSMGFRNTAGIEGHQAVAFRSQSDASAFFNCNFEGYQDTLYYQTNRQYYRNCTISGTIDFIFGKGLALIQDSTIILRMPGPGQANTVTADGNVNGPQLGGLVLQNCKLVAEPALFPNRFKVRSFLGRPWGKNAITAVIESDLGDVIAPAGWTIWEGLNNHDSSTIVEYGNRGPSANTNQRINWKGYRAITDRNQVVKYTAGPFLERGTKQPIKFLAGLGEPVNFGFTY